MTITEKAPPPVERLFVWEMTERELRTLQHLLDDYVYLRIVHPHHVQSNDAFTAICRCVNNAITALTTP